MFVQQLYTKCLSEAAYYIESEGEAAIIDPLRDTEDYIRLAADRNATIKYIFETHLHADFVSGHLDLSRATGAPIIFGPGAQTSYSILVAEDGQKFQLGAISITALHTPGHTIESTCWLLKDEQEKDYALFTGDTLFIGDVGRPDLNSGNLGSNELAGMLYDSLQQKVLPLADEILVYPAHGQGSACGKNLSSDTFSTLGEQKRNNYALQTMTRDQFIAKLMEGINEAPKYFETNIRLNKEGYEALEKVKAKGMVPLSVEQFKKRIKEEKLIVLDSRKSEVFAGGFIPGSVSIGLDGRFAEWAGSLLPFDHTLLLVCESNKEEESVLRLARVGFNKMEGYLSGGFEAWKDAGEPIDMIIEVEPDELMMDLPYDEKLVVVDVRNETEFASGHLPNAVNLPLKDMTDPGRIAMLPEDANLYVHCATGYRSMIASSLIKRQGIASLRHIQGGWNALKQQESVVIEKEKSILN